MNKKYLILVVMALAACDVPQKTEECTSNRRNADGKTWERVFNSCMANIAKARQGRDYTTNDDEDLDEVVGACSNAANQSTPRIYVRTCVPVVRTSMDE